ncbi:MAG TPA: CBS domain-containing protein, partial [Chthoniobacterales bacterium]|nr:CBS domain-containing protein [Chthoniobacterales bacterium]
EQHGDEKTAGVLITYVSDIFALLLATRTLVRSFGMAGYLIVALAAIPIYLFVLGVLPKSLFRRFPIPALAALGGLLELVSRLLWPLLELGERLGRILLPRRVSDRARLFAAREELKQVAVQSEREGALTSTERAMIHNVVDFRNVCARDVMVPLDKCVSVQPQTDVSTVLETSKATGVDRFPVISGDGNALGLVNVLDILFEHGPPGPLAKYTRRIVTAMEHEPAYRVIRRLRAARVGLAAVVDGRRNLVGFASDTELIRRLVQAA